MRTYKEFYKFLNISIKHRLCHHLILYKMQGTSSGLPPYFHKGIVVEPARQAGLAARYPLYNYHLVFKHMTYN